MRRPEKRQFTQNAAQLKSGHNELWAVYACSLYERRSLSYSAKISTPRSKERTKGTHSRERAPAAQTLLARTPSFRTSLLVSGDGQTERAGSGEGGKHEKLGRTEGIATCMVHVFGF